MALFGPPLLIEGEDPDAYDQLLARIFGAVKPVDVIYEMYTADFVSLEWEVLRYRRLKWSSIRERVLEALRGLSDENLEDDLCSDYVEHYFAQFLESALPEDQADTAQTLARKCARNETDAVEKVKQLLADIGFTIRSVWEDARARKARELVEQYERRERKALRLIHKILAGAGKSMDALMEMHLSSNSTISSGSIAWRPSPRAAATPACTRSSGVTRSLAKRCDGACKRSRTASLKRSRRRQPKEKTRLDERPQDQGQPRECAGQHRPEDC